MKWSLLLLWCLICHNTFSQQLEGFAKSSPYLAKTTFNASTRILPGQYLLQVKSIAALQRYLDSSLTPYKILRQLKSQNICQIQLHPSHLERILLHTNHVLFADAVRKPVAETEIVGFDAGVNGLNQLYSAYPNLRGDTMVVSLKENKFDTSDIDLRGRVIPSDRASGLLSSHATVMATLLAGAGNSFELFRGVAWGASLISSDFSNLLPDPELFFRKNNISVQNHSYGTGIENYYGVDAAGYDALSQDDTVLVHVFSAGNQGSATSSSGAYREVAGFANLTGSFKMAKNVLTVGAVDTTLRVWDLSSRGPAHDGRVKPDLVAFGIQGSSGAAAIVSGIATLTQEMYRRLRGDNPPSFLTKAILLNTADDIASPGPDFSSGFGNANAYKAVLAVAEERFKINTISEGEEVIYRISIPENTVLAKFLIYWNDVPAPANAAHALLNDLDLMVKHSSSGETYMPWILDATPSAQALSAIARRGLDTLNNVEQVTLHDPLPGDYEVIVRGGRIAGRQSFALTHELLQRNRFSWRSPSRNEKTEAGSSYYLRFENSHQASRGKIEINYGNDWELIHPDASLTSGYLRIDLRDTTCIARVRVSVEGLVYTSDSFIVSRILNPRVGFVCNDSAKLYWSRLPYSSFQIYTLNEKYIEPLHITNDSTYTADRDEFVANVAAVAPLLPSGEAGLRSRAVNILNQGTGCFITSFLADLVDDEFSRINLELGTLHSITQIALMKESAGSTRILHTIDNPASLTFTWIDSSLSQGINRYRVVLKTSSGTEISGDWEEVFYFASMPFIVYPNPLPPGSSLRISTQNADDVEIHFYDITGRLLLRRRINQTTEHFSSTLFPKGLIIYRIYRKSFSQQTGRFFVQ